MPEQPGRYQCGAHYQQGETEVTGWSTQVRAHRSAEMMEEENERETETDECQ